jgi:hypothetical protein
MKNFFLIILLIIFGISFNSCKKNRVPIGEYEFVFKTGTEELYSTPISLSFEIIESTKKFIIIESSIRDTLYKNASEIKGTITIHGGIPSSAQNIFYTPFDIIGVYEKKNGVYSISGSFKSKIIIPNPTEERMDTTNISGIFELKPNF